MVISVSVNKNLYIAFEPKKSRSLMLTDLEISDDDDDDDDDGCVLLFRTITPPLCGKISENFVQHRCM